MKRGGLFVPLPVPREEERERGGGWSWRRGEEGVDSRTELDEQRLSPLTGSAGPKGGTHPGLPQPCQLGLTKASSFYS